MYKELYKTLCGRTSRQVST